MLLEDTPLLTIKSHTLTPLSVSSSISHPVKNSFLGLGLILIGVITLFTIALFVVILGKSGVPFLQLTFIRNFVVLTVTGAIIAYRRKRGENMTFFGPKKERTALVVRAVLFYGNLNFFYWALLYIPIGMATMIDYTFPLFTAILMHWGCCSKPEKLSKFAWLCTVIGFTGTFFVLSSDESYNAAGVILALLCSFCMTFETMIIRRTRAEAHWLQIEFLSSFLHTLILTPSVWLIQWIVYNIMHVSDYKIVNVNLSAFLWGECILIGAIAFIGLACFTRGFQLEEAPRGAIIMYLAIPFSYFLQWLAFGSGVSCSEFCGILLILFGTVASAVEKILIEKRKR